MTGAFRGLRFLPFVLLGAALLWPGLAFGQTTPAAYHDRADQALQSFLLKFWNGGRQYLRHRYPSDGSLTGYWTYAHGWDAVIDGAERTHGLDYTGWIETFYLGQNDAGWYSDFYDDECWMTLTLLRAFEVTGEAKYLSRAQTLYTDIMTGWDTNCCGSTRGGVWWDKAKTQKATAANAGAALAGARLYRFTGNALYLTFAQQVYAFWYANMVNASTGQVCDHFNPDGSKVWWRFTYNEGLMIGASLELHEVTGTASYLANAHRIAGYMVTQEVAGTRYGAVLHDGDNNGCGGDCHQFKGAAYRYLALLYLHDKTKTQYFNVLRNSAEAVWNLARETNSTIFSVSWAGPPQTSVDQPQNNAACVALNIFAKLQGGYEGPGVSPNQYEAENATLRRLGVETNYGVFTGWAYVAGWNSDGQSVDFKINCATSGQHTLTFRYAAGAGNTYRVIRVNGTTLVARQTFAGTGSWPTYNTVSVDCTLPAGPSTISVAFSAAQNSGNYLNLDHLTVSGDAPEEIRISNIELLPNGGVRVSWNSRPRHLYRLQSCIDPASSDWTDVGAPIVADGAVSVAEAPAAAAQARWFRIRGGL